VKKMHHESAANDALEDILQKTVQHENQIRSVEEKLLNGLRMKKHLQEKFSKCKG
jgi:hypothetical protein